MATEENTATEADLKVKEKQTMEKKQELMKSLQNQVDEVDRNVTDLAKSFDSLYEHLCKRSEKLEYDIASRNQDKDKEDTDILSITQENVSHLIRKAKTVAENKEKTIWSLSKLIHFIHADTEDICTDHALGRCEALDIDAYLKKGCPSAAKNGETLIELLEEQNQRLQEKYKLAREHVKIVSEREKIVNEDRNLLRERLKKLESKISVCNNSHFGDVDKRSYTYIGKDADSVSFPPTYDSEVSASTRSMRTTDVENERDNRAYEERITELQSELQRIRNELNDKEQTLRIGVDRDVQTSGSDDMTGENKRYHQEHEQRITELQSVLQSVQDKLKDKEQLLRSVVCRDVYEVTMDHLTTTRPHRIEEDLIQKLNEEVERQNFRLHIKKSHFARGPLNILTCIRDNSRRTWESIFESAASWSSDPSKVVLVVLYAYGDKKNFAEARTRKCAVLEKFITVFLEYGSNFYSYRKEIRDIIRLVKSNGNRSREVISCVNCKKTRF